MSKAGSVSVEPPVLPFSPRANAESDAASRFDVAAAAGLQRKRAIAAPFHASSKEQFWALASKHPHPASKIPGSFYLTNGSMLFNFRLPFLPFSKMAMSTFQSLSTNVSQFCAICSSCSNNSKAVGNLGQRPSTPMSGRSSATSTFLCFATWRRCTASQTRR